MNTVKVPLPGGSNVRLVGITNSGNWTQEIAFSDPAGHGQTWTGRGSQTNNIVGTYVIPAEEAGTLTVTMTWDDGSGPKPSTVKVDSFNLLGMSGYVIGV